MRVVGPLDAGEFSSLYTMLGKVNVPLRSKQGNNSRRGFGTHRSMTFGLVRPRFTSRICTSRATRDFPDIHAEIVRLGKLLAPDFEFASIHLNKNVVCPPHKDSTNVGLSMVVSFGEYTGCELVVDGAVVDARHRGVIFDGSSVEHSNIPTLGGTKYSLVYFQPQCSRAAPPSQKADLACQGSASGS
jgi:hypothetical protein